MKKTFTILVSLVCIGALHAGAWAPGPGLQVKINSVTIGNDLLPVIEYSMTDDKGVPLTLDDVGAPRFIMAHLVVDDAAKMMMHYESYTIRIQTSPDEVSAEQATYDSGGTNEPLGGGYFRYTFGTALPADYNMSETHTVSAQIQRSMEEATYYGNPVFHFVPDGSDVTLRKEITTTETCNTCHNGLGIHGGGRREYVLCVTCHNPGSTDPDTGNTVDMGTMIHKIHRGAELTNLPYQIVGFRQSVHDYSNVHFPMDIRNCESCHTGPQGDHWKTVPSREACGSCHDHINWETGDGHNGGPAANDNMCATCHPAEGAEFGLSVSGAHTILERSTALRGLTLDILSVEAAAGAAPLIRFTINNADDGSLVPLADMGRTRFVITGPTSDYTSYDTSDALVEGTTVLDGDAYLHTSSVLIPADAAGSYAVGAEARRPVTIGEESFNEQVTYNDVEYFSVDGSAVLARREVISDETCNVCHDKLSLHGGNRTSVEHCLICHSPNTTDMGDRPPEELPPANVNFKDMIHKIHSGAELANPYIVYGHNSSLHDYSDFHFSGDRKQCAVCHVGDSYTLPLPSGVLPSTVMQDDLLISMVPPASAACLSCHDSADVEAHASLNTTANGQEACTVCHGEGKDASVSEVHAQNLFLAPQEPTVPPGTAVTDWLLAE